MLLDAGPKQLVTTTEALVHWLRHKHDVFERRENAGAYIMAFSTSVLRTTAGNSYDMSTVNVAGG